MKKNDSPNWNELTLHSVWMDSFNDKKSFNHFVFEMKRIKWDEEKRILGILSIWWE